MPERCSLLILAGGRSRRMGRDKATLSAGNVTLVEHVAARLQDVVDETLISFGERMPLLHVGASLVQDHFPGMGPLAGMHAGFRAARYRLVWVVACDLPEIEPALGRLLRDSAAGVQAAVPRIDGQAQGLCAVYRRHLAPRVEQMLRAGGGSVNSLLDQIDARYLEAEVIRTVDPSLRSFHNVNTPDEYEAWLRSR